MPGLSTAAGDLTGVDATGVDLIGVDMLFDCVNSVKMVAAWFLFAISYGERWSQDDRQDRPTWLSRIAERIWLALIAVNFYC